MEYSEVHDKIQQTRRQPPHKGAVVFTGDKQGAEKKDKD
jgi:hypothetical protein